MIKMEIKRGIEEYVLQIEPVTQICGTNFFLKNFIRDSLYKYFSSSKYLSFEMEMIDNITMFGNNVGKEYFDVIQINNREDLIKNIAISKNSIMQEYVGEILHAFDSQKEIEFLKDELDRVFISLNNELKIDGIEIDFEMDDIFKLVSKTVVVSENGKGLEEMSNEDLIKIFLRVFSGIQSNKPTKKLVIFNGVDMLVNSYEYKSIVREAMYETKKSDSWFMFFIGTDNYLFLDEEFFEGINVINSEIFSMPEYDRILEFFISNYPRNIDRNQAIEIVRMLPGIIHKVGDETYNIDLMAITSLKIINDSLGIKTLNERKDVRDDRLEKEYLNF